MEVVTSEDGKPAIRLNRDELPLLPPTGEIESLRRARTEALAAAERLAGIASDLQGVLDGLDCGIGVDAVNGIQPGDIIEVFNTEEVARTL